MRRVCRLALALGCSAVLVACESIPVEDRPPRRTTGVREGPELVFKRPVEEVIPELAGATATGENGRVGPELVFWTYRMQDGQETLLHACAELAGVDCSARAALICPAGPPTPVLATSANGDVRRLDCQAVGTAMPGDLRPGCTDQEFESELVVGLAQCPQ